MARNADKKARKKAKLRYRQKLAYPDGAIREMVLWQLPRADKERPHSLKYSLYYGTATGECVIRYDNERGKGDHRHYGDYEEAYAFTTEERLVKDFLADIRRHRGENDEQED
jgi:hypothetical protein